MRRRSHYSNRHTFTPIHTYTCTQTHVYAARTTKRVRRAPQQNEHVQPYRLQRCWELIPEKKELKFSQQRKLIRWRILWVNLCDCIEYAALLLQLLLLLVASTARSRRWTNSTPESFESKKFKPLSSAFERTIHAHTHNEATES